MTVDCYNGMNMFPCSKTYLYVYITSEQRQALRLALAPPLRIYIENGLDKY